MAVSTVGINKGTWLDGQTVERVRHTRVIAAGSAHFQITAQILKHINVILDAQVYATDPIAGIGCISSKRITHKNIVGISLDSATVSTTLSIDLVLAGW